MPAPVYLWPQQQPEPAAKAFVLALALPPTLPRPQARLALRQALREALAPRLGLAAAELPLETGPGLAPRLLGHRVGISFSHEAGLSLAAVNLLGPVGVDLLREEAAPPDWQAVARDYLGPQACARMRPQDFGPAWAAHEARLKFHGRGLSEWQAGMAEPAWLAACQCQALRLPPGWVGSLALPAGQGSG
ncbi:4'-phosphopantetheinyl transferase [Paucibacter oligotrophus]|uniref:4'-phosphopantetheinyl transferase n=1 Tax=Roseateles oligotrophus TaxID=1769250 RepID=A0A840L6Z4_9BURK|nr:4-phosphopantetheinyl transferase [Roseateles oligotrophus]MBB4842462.1 4'-phosphopantetheinyl transferase [Roseateles oligotrophus]